jgi:hypothetical protein
MPFGQRQNRAALLKKRGSDGDVDEDHIEPSPAEDVDTPEQETELIQADSSPPPPLQETSVGVASDPEPVTVEGDSDVAEEPASRMWEDVPSRGPSIGNVRPETMPILDGVNVHRLPMCVSDGGRIGAWWLSAASIVGTSHLATARTRQDDYCYALLDDGSLISVVTDGLGSYKDSAQVGAGLMARTMIQVAQRHTADGRHEDLLAQSLLDAQPLVAGMGEQMYGLSPEQLSCTLVACRLTTAGTTEFVRVGDAEAFVLAEGGNEFESVFGGLEDALVNMVEASCPRARPDDVERASGAHGTRVVLASDGLAADIRLSKALRRFLDAEWRKPTSAALMLDTLRYRRQGSHDDRTGLVAWLLGDG